MWEVILGNCFPAGFQRGGGNIERDRSSWYFPIVAVVGREGGSVIGCQIAGGGGNKMLCVKEKRKMKGRGIHSTSTWEKGEV